METEQLRTIAKDAQINHWPPHLGLNTDAERIHWLAQQLESAVELYDRIDELEDDLATQKEWTDAANGEVEELRDEIAKLKEKAK